MERGKKQREGGREGKGQSAKQVTYKFLSRLAYGSTSARNPQSNILYPQKNNFKLGTQIQNQNII